MKENAFFVDFWPKLEKTYKKLVFAVKGGQEEEVKRQFDTDTECLSKYWEAKYFLYYKNHLIKAGKQHKQRSEAYKLNSLKLDRALKKAGSERGIEDIGKSSTTGTLGEPKLEEYFTGFALFHEFDFLPVPRAIIAFLDFCLNYDEGVLSAYYSKPDFASQDASLEAKEARNAAKKEAKARLSEVVADLKKYVSEFSSSDDWLSAANETAIPFVGRESELAELKAFARGNPKQENFQLWALVGPSGAGKTRLLNHWSRSLRQESWTHIKISPDTRIQWQDWLPEGKTLLSIDYIYGYDDVITDIISRAQQVVFKHPVRLLLLDHAIPDDMKDLLKDPRWGFEGRSADSLPKCFFKQSPLKLVAPDSTDEEASSAYNQFLAQIMITVAYKGEDNVPDALNAPDIQRGLTYLNQTTGARQPLFAALVGNAIRRKKDGGGEIDDYFELNRRELIMHYFQGSNRLTWKLDDNKLGKWAACSVAAATAIRGAKFRGLIHGIPEQEQEVIANDEKFKSLCNAVVSGHDPATLKAYEPDILGETFFLRFLEDCPSMERHVSEQIIAGAARNQEQSAAEFVSFITRLARNLSNDDQNAPVTAQSWEQIMDLLQARAFSELPSLRWAVALACFEIYQLLTEKKQNRLANVFLEMTEADNLYQSPVSVMRARHVWQAISYFALQEKSKEQLVPASLKQLLSDWDGDETRDYSALMLALWAKCTIVTQYLMEKDETDVSRIGIDGWTALMFACRFEQPKVAMALVDANVNLSAQNNRKWTALMMACRYNQPEVALALVDANANLCAQNNKNVTALMLACRYDQPEVAIALVGANANLSAQDNEKWTALMFACRYNQPEVAMALVDANANLSAQDNEKWTALMFACLYNQPEVAMALVDANANLSAQNNENVTALMIACRYDQPEVAIALVGANANLSAQDNEKWTALMVACRYDQPEIAMALINNKAELDAQNNKNWTALMVACCYNQPEIAMALINNKAELDAQNNKNWTALMFACRYDQPEIAMALINNKAELDAQNNNKMTALMLACRYDQPEVAMALINKGVGINYSNQAGQTPLMFAVVSNKLSLVETLIARGVDMDARVILEGHEATALGLAREADHHEIVELLEAEGALELPSRER